MHNQPEQCGEAEIVFEKPLSGEFEETLFGSAYPMPPRGVVAQVRACESVTSLPDHWLPPAGNAVGSP